MYEQELAINNLQELMCHKTQPTNQPECEWEDLLEELTNEYRDFTNAGQG